MGFTKEIFEEGQIVAEIREISNSQKSGGVLEPSQKSLRLWVELIEQSALDLIPETSYCTEVSKKRYSVIFVPRWQLEPYSKKFGLLIIIHQFKAPYKNFRISAKPPIRS